MMKSIRIGIEKKAATALVDKLNVLLAHTQMFYINTRGLHWNIRGEKFFELHLKFEELYNDLNLKVDEIAERILTLEGTPLHTYSAYAKNSKIKELIDVSDSVEGIDSILQSLSLLISQERDILSIANEAYDEGTSALMSDYIRQQEKLVWMYSAYAQKD